MIDSNQTSVVHDWVILSLSNFTQRTPLAMAIWSLTCFFISASVSQWLRALYLFGSREPSCTNIVIIIDRLFQAYSPWLR